MPLKVEQKEAVDGKLKIVWPKKKKKKKKKDCMASLPSGFDQSVVL